MALRYSYGKYGWGLDPQGKFRTPQELGKYYGFNEEGYNQWHFNRYVVEENFLINPDWVPGSMEIRVRYSKDPFGNYYMDPNGMYTSIGVLDKKAKFIQDITLPYKKDFMLVKNKKK